MNRRLISVSSAFICEKIFWYDERKDLDECD